MDIKRKLPELTGYFSRKSDIAMAFLSGSYAKGSPTSESDIDIGLYFYPVTNRLEWEESQEYPGEDEIWNDMEKITGLRTDLIILNRVPATVAYYIIQENIPIII
ncbi:MAG: nucleotidyltransferase domain-containing protein [Spirochaetota bacterium]